MMAKQKFCTVFWPTRLTKALLNAALTQKIFQAQRKCTNYCLLHAHLVIKSVFGILTQCYCSIFIMPIAVNVDLADLIVKVPCFLYNFLMCNFTLMYDATGKGSWGSMHRVM